MTTMEIGLRAVPAERAKGRCATLPATGLTAATAVELGAAGYERVVVDGPVPAGRDIDEDVRLLRFLREATRALLRVQWTLGGRPLVEPRDLVHLVPPTDGVGPDAAEFAAAWRAGYRYGLYYYRQGPGFVTVKDVRPGGTTVHLTIDGESAQQFHALAGACTVSELDDGGLDALADAVEYGLVLRGREELLMLPFRVRSWPVPYSAI